MYEMNEAEKKLVAALRSGKYKQTTRVLKNGDSYCCLGVACEISNKGHWENFGNREEYIGEFNVLPRIVRDSLHWYDIEGRLTVNISPRDEQDKGFLCWYLSTLNDWGITFDQIADFIEAGLVRHNYDEDDEDIS